MEVAHAVTEVIRVARNTTGLLFAFVHDDAGHAATTQLDRSTQSGRTTADDQYLVAAHRTPIQSPIGLPEHSAAKAHTSAEQ